MSVGVVPPPSVDEESDLIETSQGEEWAGLRQGFSLWRLRMISPVQGDGQMRAIREKEGQGRFGRMMDELDESKLLAA